MSPKKNNKQRVAGLPVRAGALFLLRAVLERQQPLDDTLSQSLASSPMGDLAPRDLGFVRAIASSVLRRLGQIDAVLDKFMQKPLPLRANGVRHILRIGAAELLFLKTPPHAAVSVALALAETEKGLAPYKALINAVLRRISREGERQIKKGAGPIANIPDWMVSGWNDQFGAATAQAIAAALCEEAELDISCSGDAEQWAEKLGGRLLPTGSVRVNSSGRIDALPGFEEGAWWVQDAAAALPVRLLGPVADKDVLDLCAAPGGKTMQLVASGARVTAVDRSKNRLKRLEQNLERLHFNAETIVADLVKWQPERRWSHILLDAPCTATGTARRHPDVLHLKHQEDIGRLAALQKSILDRVVDWLEPGGILVFCTCSLEAAEGPEHVQKFLQQNANMEHVPIEAAEIADQSDFVTAQGDLRTLPCHWSGDGGVDGFFSARFRRTF
ncbi:MAG: RsmB/NOP family class I SAM-dependent RNA methyltransferase [Stappiaceae bacterium]